MEFNQKERYDEHAKKLKTLKAGDKVFLQNPETGKWDNEGLRTEKVYKITYQIKLKKWDDHSS